MPKLWDETIETHRRAVIDATLDSTAQLVAEHGLHAVTMSRVAAATGIGRATLYKYFSDVEAVLHAWHDRQVSQHLAQLIAARDRTDGAPDRLIDVLHTYAQNIYESRRHHDTGIAEMLHRDERTDSAHQQLLALVGDLLRDAVEAGVVREDVPPEELAIYCLRALTAAASAASPDAVDRLVTLTVAGTRPVS